jgi:hypothetical protein
VARGKTKAALLFRFLEENRPVLIDTELLEVIRKQIGSISDDYLHRLLKEAKWPLAPFVEGVSLASFPDLERTLCNLQDLYEAGDAAGRRTCRQLVIQAKDRLRWSMRSRELDSEAIEAKQEMMLWMQTWLENPGLFDTWVKVRKGRGKYGTQSTFAPASEKNPQSSQ